MLLQREVNQLFERLAVLDRLERPPAGEWRPNVDVFEREGQVLVVVEVPGLAPEALRVTCRDSQLVISGERRERRMGAGTAGFLCLERPRGRFTRTVPLERALDLRQARARLLRGLLTITIPRLKERRDRETEIPVQRED